MAKSSKEKNAAPKHAAKKPNHAQKKVAPAKPQSKPAKIPGYPEPARAPRESKAARTARVTEISSVLRRHYAKLGCALDFKSPFQLLLATILAAQSTDVGVNKVTPQLFKEYPTPKDLAAADPAKIEQLIHTTGFFRQKTKAIMGAARAIVEDFKGKTPEAMEDSTKLPGVGRKTAHVVRGNALGLPAIIVDTHVIRVSARLAIDQTADPAKIEQSIAALIPEKNWTDFSNSMTWHGRKICHARNPDCPNCPVLQWCPTGKRLT